MDSTPTFRRQDEDGDTSTVTSPSSVTTESESLELEIPKQAIDIEELLKTVPFLCIPMLCGFKRMTVAVKSNDKEGKNAVTEDVAYISPTKEIFRTMDQIQSYLIKSSINIPLSFFTLDPHIRPTYTYPRTLWKQLIHKLDISDGKEKVPISALCYNRYLAEKWKLTEYVTECVPAPNLDVPFEHTDESLTCCDCTDGCQDITRCICRRLTLSQCSDKKRETLGDTNIGYTHHRLYDQIMSGIYECNKMCKCSKSCVNRVVQNGLYCQLQLFMTDNKGWGVRALVDIPQGAFISTYSGKIVSAKFADDVSKSWRSSKWRYLSVLDVGEVDKEGYEEECVEPSSPPSPPLPSLPIIKIDLTEYEENPEPLENDEFIEQNIHIEFPPNDVSPVENEAPSNAGTNVPFEFLEPDPPLPANNNLSLDINQSQSDIPPLTLNSYLGGNQIPKSNPLFQLSFSMSRSMSLKNEFSRASGACILGKRTPKVTQTRCLTPITDPDEVREYFNWMKKVNEETVPPELIQNYRNSRIFDSDATTALNALSLPPPPKAVQDVPVMLPIIIPSILEEPEVTVAVAVDPDEVETPQRSFGRTPAEVTRRNKKDPFCQRRRKKRKRTATEKQRLASLQEKKHELLRLNLNVDGHDMGNVGRYINHSCDPNIFPQFVFTNTHDLRFPTIAFFAARNIYAGEELGWDYNYEFVDAYLMECRCGAVNCKSRMC